MKHLALLFLVCLVIAGCSAPSEPAQSGAAPGAPAKAAPTTSSPGPTEQELEAKLDLKTYPGAKLVKSEIVKSKDIPETETRYRILLETPDPMEKVVAFYEKQLSTSGTPMSEAPQVMGLTPKGQQTIVKLERKGEVTSIAISNIGR